MQLTENMIREFRVQAEVKHERSFRCSSCCHFSPLPLQKPGIYLGPQGTCSLISQVIDNAELTTCGGWQSNIGNRREDVTKALAASSPKEMPERVLLQEIAAAKTTPKVFRKRIEKLLKGEN